MSWTSNTEGTTKKVDTDVINDVTTKTKTDSMLSKGFSRRSLLAATRQTTSFNLKGNLQGITKKVRRLSQGSSLGSTRSFHTLSDDDDSSSSEGSSLFGDTKFVFDLEDDEEEEEEEEKDEATAVFVTEHGFEPFAQFHCRQLEILCSD